MEEMSGLTANALAVVHAHSQSTLSPFSFRSARTHPAKVGTSLLCFVHGLGVLWRLHPIFVWVRHAKKRALTSRALGCGRHRAANININGLCIPLLVKRAAIYTQTTRQSQPLRARLTSSASKTRLCMSRLGKSLEAEKVGHGRLTDTPRRPAVHRRLPQHDIASPLHHIPPCKRVERRHVVLRICVC